MYGVAVDFAMQNNGNYMQMPYGNVHPQQMEWLMMQQRVQGNQQAVNASRAYHLEPMNTSQQQHQGPPPAQQQQLQPTGNALMMNSNMGMLQQYAKVGVQPQPQQQQQLGMGSATLGYGGANNANMSNGLGNNSGVVGVNGESGAGDWNQINFQGVFQNAGDPQMQQNVFMQDDGKPLPFPPGHLLAQYPSDYQQQMMFYYRLLRLQYPELYQQYVDYYENYYEPLYFPRPPTPEVEERRAPAPKKKNPPAPQPQPQLQPQPRPAPPPSQPVAPPPQVVQPFQPPMQEPPAEPSQKKSEGLRCAASNLSGGLSRQSSMRRQNSMRRAEVNQLKNEGGLKRLPSMRKS